ncbi:C-type lectin lectoxin-Enh4-like [Hyalella azteca]|uniref:C-type lectin lectoxin-Enh4-like n=1 Tax=Hyalella azteca TaxID=294128 RepID=A0A8B7NN59_HYAAZ|nr:C-type lectin lectoxin-Enh4-like [Hyalella azteca]
MTLFTDAKITGDCTTSTLEAPSACVCRNRCFVDTQCLAVSITQAASVSKCHFSSSASVLTTVLITNPAFITFTKKRDACMPGFEAVGGFCYFFSADKVDFTTAKSSCPSGSVLAYPSSATQMADLVAYLKCNKSGMSDWWVDLTLNAGKWLWSDGTATTGANLGNSDDGACARLYANYELNDKPCSNTFRFICQYKV